MSDENTTAAVAKTLWEEVGGENDYILFIGSGLSILPGSPKDEGDVTSQSGYPDWKSAVFDLCSVCGVNPPKDIPAHKNKRESILIDTAEVCKQTNPDAYYNRLRELYGSRGRGTRPEYYSMFKMPFEAIITTNFDPLLAQANKHEEQQLYAYPKLPAIKIGAEKRPIFYIHGIAEQNGSPDSRNLVFARSEYDQAYNHQFGPTSLFLRTMLLEYRVLFIGAEPDSKVQECIKTIERMKSLVNGDIMPDGSTHKHNRKIGYILLSERYTIKKSRDAGDIIWSDSGAVRNEDLEERENQDYNRLGIEVVRYRRGNNYNHDEIEQIFDEIISISKRQSEGIRAKEPLPDA